MEIVKLNIDQLEPNAGQIDGLPVNPRQWTRTDIAPGAKGTIDVTYTNDEGPYPFDKTLTVYLSDLDKPVILHVKGTAYKGKK